MVAALYVFGVNSVKIFTLPLMVGITAGTFSSILMAPAIWMILDAHIGKKKKHKGVKSIR